MRQYSIFLALAAGMLLTSCAAGAQPSSVSSRDSNHEHSVDRHWAIDDPTVELDITRLASAADLVVRGRVGSVTEGVRIGDNMALYSVFTLDVTEAHAGSPGSGTIRVAMMSSISGEEADIVGRPMASQGDEGIWFLTKVDPSFNFDGYVLTGIGGILLADGDGNIVNDVGEAVSVEEAVELETLDAVDDVLEQEQEQEQAG